MFSLFKSKSFQPAWVYESTAWIWRFLFSNGNYYILEIRWKEEKKVQFMAIHNRTGKVIWDGLELDEKWFIGIESVFDDILFLHGFLDPNVPEHYGIYAINAKTGELMWYDTEKTYYHYVDNQLIVYEPTDDVRVYYALDPLTGKQLKSLTQNEMELENLRQATPQYEGLSSIRYADHWAFDDTDKSELIQFFKQFMKQPIISMGLDVLDVGEKIVLGYYRKDDTLDICYDLLMIQSRTGKIIVKEVLASHLKGSAGDQFFLHDSQLVTFKDRKKVLAFDMLRS